MEESKIDAALWAMYKHLGGQTVDSIEVPALATYLLEVLGVGSGGADAGAVVEARIRRIRRNRARLAELRALPHIPQRSPEWYELRRQRLTASDAAQAMGKGKFGTRAQLVEKKQNERAGRLAPFNSNSPPLKWGTMFEEMATRCYAHARAGMVVHEFGLIPHPTLGCFGASPDGISELGTMVEIKCPYRRKINGEIPEQYWIQMQGQMAVCGISECDYIECDMEAFADKADYYVRTAGETANHGVIAEYTRKGKDGFEYDYSDPGLTAIAAYRSMEKRSLARMQADPDLQLDRLTPWRLRYMNIIRVPYHHEKWMAMVPQIEAFWQDVLAGPRPGATLDLRGGGGSPDASPVTGGAGRGKAAAKYRFLDSDEEDDDSPTRA